MTDQAARLRNMNSQASHQPWGTPTLVFGSGKGGVGKSIVSIATASRLADSGFNVLLLDGDLNLANLHILLGVEPVARIETLLHGDVTPADLIVEISENLSLLPGDSGGELFHTLGAVERARLYHRLTDLSDLYDVVVVDAGAGIDNVLRCVAVPAARPIVVTVPEPAALADAYAVIKMINLQVRDTPIAVLVNRVDSEGQGRAAFERLDVASRQFLGRPIGYLGALPEDTALRAAVRDMSPFWRGDTPLTRSIRECVDRGREQLALATPSTVST